MEITNPLGTAGNTNHAYRWVRFVAILGIVVIVVAVAIAGIQILTGKRSLRSFLPKWFGGAGAPTVELQEEYRNPFHQETQYVNPFEETKNPFRNL